MEEVQGLRVYGLRAQGFGVEGFRGLWFPGIEFGVQAQGFWSLVVAKYQEGPYILLLWNCVP